MTKFPKSLTVIATAAALVAGVAFAQGNPATQPSPNTTGQPGSALGAQQPGSTMGSGSTMNNSGSTAGSTSGTTMDSGSTMNNNAQSDIVSPEPRADRN